MALSMRTNQTVGWLEYEGECYGGFGVKNDEDGDR